MIMRYIDKKSRAYHYTLQENEVLNKHIMADKN